jgi:hypothetical protein
VVLKDDGAGQAGVQSVSNKREAQQVASDLSQENKVQEVIPNPAVYFLA